MADVRRVVVDGSNLATEGRKLPSLQQLDDAVRAYSQEDPGAEIVVVVDASFGHRIDTAEKHRLDEAELHGEIVSPPAGAIGRGDAFVLRIAERTGARVLSNDSFQEFQEEHPWLFDADRLIGGKPVPGVGWIFTPRLPVRGAKSPRGAGKKKRLEDSDAGALATEKAAELAKAVRKAVSARAAAARDDSAPQVGDVWTGKPVLATAKRTVKKTAKKVAKAPAKKATEKSAEKAAEKAVAKSSTAKTTKSSAAPSSASATKRRVAKSLEDATGSTPVKASTKKSATTKSAKATNPTKATKRTRRGVSAADSKVLLAVIEEAKAEALEPPPRARSETKGDKRKKEGKSQAKKLKDSGEKAPLPAVNDPLSFITFVTIYPLGSEVVGDVVAFTSHGAMVSVGLPDGTSLNCYIPLGGMAVPAPTKAREVLRRGERRSFVLVGLDPLRRVAELGIPGVTG